MRKAGELGLSGVDVPEQYGGMQLDKVTSALIADRIAKYGSFSTAWGAHTCIGTLPIVYFGTEEQKKKYLPGLASGVTVGAYALSESSSGSDALNCRTRATLSTDRKHYLLNGEKMWITNAGFADLFVVFAKVDGEKFTAFIVERKFPGFSTGAEEHKMGIRGSSTCPLILNDCEVPVENVLGEIGKGHHIAFNVLNVGRIKLGAGCVGAARNSLESAIAYAKQRKAFGKVIADFGMVREKLANMAAGIFTGEAMAYRTVGMMDAAIAQLGDSHSDMSQVRKVIDEYAVECSILKVWGSEFIGYVADETVQIYGGYGFVEEYPAERAYRDARINRIFEGTNEINRLVISGFLLKRAMSGQLPLMAAIRKLMDEVISGAKDESEEGPLGEERRLVAAAKEDRTVCGWRGHAEIYAVDPGPARDPGHHRQHGHRNLRHRVRGAALAETGGQQGRSRRGICHCDGSYLHRRSNGENRERRKDGDRGRQRRRRAAFADGNPATSVKVRAVQHDCAAREDRETGDRNWQISDGVRIAGNAPLSAHRAQFAEVFLQEHFVNTRLYIQMRVYVEATCFLCWSQDGDLCVARPRSPGRRLIR